MANNLDINNIHQKLPKEFVVFAGAGASSVPQWKKLLKKLQESQPVQGVNVDEVNAYDYPEYAQMFYNQFRRRQDIDGYWLKIEEQLQNRDEPYRTLQLNIVYTTGRIITTNFEKSFEDAFRTYFMRRNKQQERYQEQITPNLCTDIFENEYSITYLHGRIDERNIIFTTAEYERYYSSDNDDNLSPLESFLEEVYCKHTIIFVGYSFLDRYLSNAFQKIYNKLNIEEKSKLDSKLEMSYEKKAYRHYAFLVKEDPELDQKLDNNLGAMGIGVVRYSEHAEVARCFERIEKSRISFPVENENEL